MVSSNMATWEQLGLLAKFHSLFEAWVADSSL